MIENIDRLSYNDKLYMIHNPKSFSLPTISTIHFNRENWMEEIELHLHPDIIKNMISTGNSICGISTISNVTRGKVQSYIGEKVTRRIDELVNMPCETKENINDIIFMFGHVLSAADVSNDPNVSQYKQDIIKYFFDSLLPWKLQAHEIFVRTNTNTMTADKVLGEYSMKTLTLLFREMICHKFSYEKISVILYLICKYLNLNERSSQLKILGMSMRDLYNYDFIELMRTTSCLLKESIDALSIISSINDPKCTDMSDIIISSAQEAVEYNYEHNKVSERLNNGGLCVGDDVFDNGAITASRLLIELAMIDKERLKDYIGENKITSFSIPENDIGFLRLRQNLPICKVMTKEDGFYTLTRYEDKSYLLFKIMGDSKCYGISFPSEYGGGRKVVMFNMPTDYEYAMSMTN